MDAGSRQLLAHRARALIAKEGPRQTSAALTISSVSWFFADVCNESKAAIELIEQKSAVSACRAQPIPWPSQRPSSSLGARMGLGPSAPVRPGQVAKSSAPSTRSSMLAFQRLTTTSFYSFDVGKRFDGTQLVNVVRDASLSRRATELVDWPSRHESRLRRRMVRLGKPRQPQVSRLTSGRCWLESAVLVRQNGSWKIDFFIRSAPLRNKHGKFANVRNGSKAGTDP